MPAITVPDDEGLGLRVGRQRVTLTPAQSFNLAELLIRGAVRAVVRDEADRALVRSVLSNSSESADGPGLA